MTSERRIIVSLGDIKYISYECKGCGAKISISPDAGLSAPLKCPQCKDDWLREQAHAFSPQFGYEEQQSSVMKFAKAVGAMRNPEIDKSYGFRILLEFAESTTPSVSQKSGPGQ
jgi:hypothetical protein